MPHVAKGAEGQVAELGRNRSWARCAMRQEQESAGACAPAPWSCSAMGHPLWASVWAVATAKLAFDVALLGVVNERVPESYMVRARCAATHKRFTLAWAPARITVRTG